MADNAIGVGADGVEYTMAFKDIGGGVIAQRFQPVFGTAGVGTDVSGSNPLPVVQTGALPAGTNNIGDVDVLSLPALAAGTAYLGQVGGELSTSAIRDGSTALTPKFAAISAASSGDNTAVAAVTSKKIRVLSYSLVADGAVTARFQSDTTDLTGAMSFAANGGISCAFSPVGHFETAAGVALQLNLGGAVGVRGHLTYVEV